MNERLLQHDTSEILLLNSPEFSTVGKKLFLNGHPMPLYDDLPEFSPETQTYPSYGARVRWNSTSRPIYGKKTRLIVDESLQWALDYGDLHESLWKVSRPLAQEGVYIVVLTDQPVRLTRFHSTLSKQGVQQVLEKKFGSPVVSHRVISPRGKEWIGIYKPPAMLPPR